VLVEQIAAQPVDRVRGVGDDAALLQRVDGPADLPRLGVDRIDDLFTVDLVTSFVSSKLMASGAVETHAEFRRLDLPRVGWRDRRDGVGKP